MTEEKRLAHVALSEAVEDRLGDAVLAVGDAVNDLRAFARDAVSVGPLRNASLPLAVTMRQSGADFERLGHRRVQLSGLFLVTVDAGVVADVTNTARVRVGPSLGEEAVVLGLTKNYDQSTDYTDFT